MTVHELVESLFAAGDWGKVADIPRLEESIRKAVIEEASVGMVTFTKEGGNSVIWFNGIALEKVGDTYSGEYRLIPEEKP